MPGAGGVGVGAVLLDLERMRRKSSPAFFERLVVLVGRPLAQAPEEIELALRDAEVDVGFDPCRPVEEAGPEGLAKRRRVVARAARS